MHDNQTNAGEISRGRADDIISWLREYASQRVNSRLIDERRCIPPYIVLDFGNRGLMGMQVAEAYGGLALRYSDYFRVLEQLAAVDLTIATVVLLNNTNGIRPIQNFARPALRDELLPVLARGRELASFALTEPGAGSHLGSMTTSAAPDGHGGWRLNGTKRWNASSWAGMVSVFARMVRPDGRLGGVSGFAIRQGTYGLRIGPEALTMGLRGSVQNALYLDNVAVTADNLLGKEGQGMTVVEDALSAGRLSIAAACLGAMKRCAQLMVRYGERRVVSTGMLLDSPVTIAKLAEITLMVSVLEACIYEYARLLDTGICLPVEVSMTAKIAASEWLNECARELVQVLGGRGYMENNIAPQMLRDAQVFTIGEGPNEGLNLFIGRSVEQTRNVSSFLAEHLAAGHLATKLTDAAQQIVARCLSRGRAELDRSASIAWANAWVGKAAIEAILLASARSAAAGLRAKAMQPALDWAAMRLETTLQTALSDASLDRLALSSEQLKKQISAYAECIGDVEQSLAGEEDALDPLLKHETMTKPHGSSPPASSNGEAHAPARVKATT